MKKTLTLILVLALSALLLCSCDVVNDFIAGNEFLNGIFGDFIGNSGNSGGGSNEPCEEHKDDDKDGVCDVCEEKLEDDAKPDGVIFTEDGVAAIIYAKSDLDFVKDAVKEVQPYVKDNLSRIFVLSDDRGTKFSHEIVFGDTNRDITDEAKAALEEKLKAKNGYFTAIEIPEEDRAGYMVYSDGASVAVVWTHFQVAELAVEYFCENYLDENSLTLEAGYSSSEFFSLDEYLTEREEVVMAEKWAALEAAIPEEYREDIMAEMHRYYALFEDKDESIVDWLASLYDVETGAWYGTVSAKVTEGFLPDIEHTYYALSMFGKTGMAEMFGGDWTKAVPYDIFQKAARWVYNLQDPDGYFYHPQWPKEYIEANDYQIRITRDKDSAKTLLKAFGINLKYAGFISSDDNLVGNLGDSTVAAVSKVVYSSLLLEEYSSTEKFKEYLDEFEESLKSMSDSERSEAFYSFSGQFQTTVILMNSEMKKMTSDFFDKHQNPENGMWSTGLYYSSTNAMHKIVSVYNQLGAEVKYAEKIVDSTLEILKWDVHTKPTSTVYDLYNVWTVFPYLYQNIRKYAPGTLVERCARCEAIKELVYEGVADAMSVSYEQMIDYSHPDGSGSIYRFYSLRSATALCPTAVRLTREGSIAGFITVNYSMPYYMLAALELEDYIIPIFTEQDRFSYVKKLMNAEPNIKGTLLLTEAKIYNFEDTPIDSVPEEITVSIGTNKVPNENAYIKVGDDGTGNRVLIFNATARVVENGRNYNATLKANHTEDDPTVAQFEFDFKLNSEKVNKHIAEMLFYAGNTATPVFQIKIGLDASGNVYATAGDGTLIGNVGVKGEYAHITVEYEWNAREYRVYSDGALVGVASYTYGGTANHEMIGSVNINSVSTTDANYYLDNVCFKTCKK